jgi:hypothetical protein
MLLLLPRADRRAVPSYARRQHGGARSAQKGEECRCREEHEERSHRESVILVGYSPTPGPAMGGMGLRIFSAKSAADLARSLAFRIAATQPSANSLPSTAIGPVHLCPNPWPAA